MPPPDLEQACWFFGAIALGGLALGGATLFILRRLLGAEFRFGRETACSLAVLGTTLLAMNPMLRTGAVGAGDAYHYALQAADFSTQVRAGVFPVLVGQSIYGFNGNIHTLRTAPYYVHFCGLVDWLTGYHLSAFALQNLVAILTAMGGATSAYLVLRALAPRSRLGSALLAILYVTAPGVTGALLGRDMYATFMAIPWLPLVIWSAVQCLEREMAYGPLALSAGSLALVWYAHPPIAVLLTPVLILAGLIRIVRGPDRGCFFMGALAASTVFLILTAYLFYSVGSMQLGYIAKEADNSGALVSDGLPKLWPGLISPISPDGNRATDLQPGYAVLVLAFAAFGLAGRKRWSGWLLVIAFTAYIATWLPPAAYLWDHLPERLIAVVQPWPHQRMMPIVAAIAIVSGGLGLSSFLQSRPAAQYAVLALLVVAVCWNFNELHKFTGLRHPVPRLAPAVGHPLPADSVVLTRSSYLLFRSYPSYYSHGFMDPATETRLLDEEMQPVMANDRYLLSHTEPEGNWHPLTTPVQFSVKPGVGCALEFSFTQPEAVGELVVSSGTMRRNFTMPASGESRAFGSSPEARHTLLVDARSHDGRLLQVHASIPGASVRLHFYDEAMQPLLVTGLVPFKVRVRAEKPGFLESPRVFIPGYHAVVNGREAPVMRSPEGLVMIPTPAGESVVQIDYPGPQGLRSAYFISFLGLLTWPAWTLACYRLPRPRIAISKALVSGTLALAAGALMAVGWGFSRPAIPAGETLQLTIDLPRNPREPNEPLVVLGQAGSADTIYLHYDDSRHFSIGYDHWGVGGPRSAPIPCTMGQRLVIELTLPALSSRWTKEKPPVPLAPVSIKVGGREVLAGNLPWYPVSPKMIAVGTNLIGASSCAQRFSGRVIEIKRGPELKESKP